MNEPIPQGIHCKYQYSPTIQHTQLVIEVNNPNLPSSWEALILKLAEIHKDKAFSLTNYEERLFNQLLTDTPTPQPGVSIEANPLLDQRNIVIKFIHKNENFRWNLPPKSNNFVGRTELLEKMEIHFNKDTTHNPLLLTACHGLGGVGKTQLALEFCWRNDQKYQNIFWFSAETQEKLINDYINLGENELHILFSGDKEDKRTPKDKAIYVKNWLQKNDKKSNEWLLVYDNAPNYQEIADLLPHRGNILITSRHIVWPGETIAVEVFTLDEAREYIKKITNIKDNPENTDQLIEILGALPLALAQACAYIKENGITIKDYLALYQEVKSELLTEVLLPPGDKHEPVMVTWNITLKKMEKECPDSIEMIYCFVFFHNENIPQCLLEPLFIEKSEALLTLKRNKAKTVAKKYSMITVDEEKKVFSLHCVVQEVIKIQLQNEKKLLDYLRKSTVCLLEVYPYEEGKNQNADSQLKRKLLLHLEAILKNHDNNSETLSYEKDRNQLEDIITYLSNAYGDLGNVQKKKELLERALILDEKHYGSEHWKVAITLGNLGSAYGDLGDVQKKKILLKRALAIFEKHYGKDHYQVANTLVNLGNAYNALGDAQKSKKLLKRALSINEKYYDKDHYQIAITLASLGTAYGISGDAKKCKELLKRALAIFEKHYGKDHYLVADTLVNLGNVYGNLGKVQKKKELFERALPILQMHYGNDHYQVAIMLTNLGLAYNGLGDMQKGKESLERALPILQTYYGKDNFQIAIALANLGIAHGALGDTQKREELLERALPILKEYYGDNHPTVRKAQSFLSANQFQFQPKNDYDTKLNSILKKFQNPSESFLPSLEVALRRAAGYGTTEDLGLLIKKVNNVNASNPFSGQTALHVAVLKGKKENVALLLAANANPDIPDSSGKTARDNDKFKMIADYFRYKVAILSQESTSDDHYNYLQKTKIEEDSSLIAYLKEKTLLKFFGTRDEEYTVDAVVEITTEADRKAAEQLQQGLNGYGRFFKMDEKRDGFVLEGINISQADQQSVSMKIQNYLFKK